MKLLASRAASVQVQGMDVISADILKAILELRAENGMEATREAAFADLKNSGAKWVLEPTPRYRRAGRSPLFISGRYLTAYGMDPSTGEADGKVRKEPSKGKAVGNDLGNARAVDEATFYKTLHAKGFPVKISQDLLSGEIDIHIPQSITKLDLQFGAIPGNAAGIHVTRTSPQIQMAMPLDKFLELVGIKA